MRRSATRIAGTKRLENKIQIFMLRHCYTANIILLSWLLFPRLQNDGFIILSFKRKQNSGLQERLRFFSNINSIVSYLGESVYLYSYPCALRVYRVYRYSIICALQRIIRIVTRFRYRQLRFLTNGDPSQIKITNL